MIRIVDKLEETKIIYKKATPKQKARDILHSALIQELQYWQEKDYITDDMTENEIKKVNDQMEKEIEKILKKWNIY